MTKNNEDEDTRGIRAALILEILGRPKEHLVETLKGIIDQISKEPRVSLKGHDIKEPVLMKDQADLYTTFADIEVEVDGITDLVILMFKYMPAHVEVITPELIALTNTSWSDILSELTRRLHGYEEIVRISQVEKGILENKLREIFSKIQKGELKSPNNKQKPEEKTVKKKSRAKKK